MSDLTEKEFQNWLAGRIADLGWELTLDDDDLSRPWEEVVRWDELTSALERLNPEIAEQPERAQQVIAALRAVLLSSAAEGLIGSNREFAAWLAERLPAFLAPRGLLLSDQELPDTGLTVSELPTGVGPDLYFCYANR